MWNRKGCHCFEIEGGDHYVVVEVFVTLFRTFPSIRLHSYTFYRTTTTSSIILFYDLEVLNIFISSSLFLSRFLPCTHHSLLFFFFHPFMLNFWRFIVSISSHNSFFLSSLHFSSILKSLFLQCLPTTPTQPAREVASSLRFRASGQSKHK